MRVNHGELLGLIGYFGREFTFASKQSESLGELLKL
jgi:hypothetical protein